MGWRSLAMYYGTLSEEILDNLSGTIEYFEFEALETVSDKFKKSSQGSAL